MIGRRLLHYEVMESLGAGGMGEVYRAHDTRLNRDVAIKVLPTDRPLRDNSRRRFQREAMAASSLNHPNIITIYEINNEGNTDFIVMEYVRGATLSSLLKTHRMGLDEAMRYGIQIADALTKAHAAGIIHRDLKPGNVMITEDGLVKVLDFGLAKFSDPVSTPGAITDPEATNQFSLTQPGSVTGTVAYMSPEQARGDKVDTRSDIFSFGIVMFELLSGQLPFAGQNSIALLHNLHFSAPRDLSQLRPDLPAPLVSLISRMLEKDLNKRIQTMAEVASELRMSGSGMVDGPLTWRPSAATIEMVRPGSESVWNKLTKRKLWVGAALIVLLTAGVFGGRYWLKKSRTPSASATAQEAPIEDSAYPLYQRSRDYLDHYDREGNVDRAIKLLERALQLDSQSAASYAALGEAYYLKNRSNPDPQWMKLASEYASKAVALDNDLAAGHVSLGLVQMQAGDSAEAEKQFRAAVSLDPKSSVPHRALGNLYYNTGKHEQGVEELKHALRLDPKDWKAYLNLGGFAYQSANYSEAASNWEQASKLEPQSIQAPLNLGAVYHLLGRDDDAAAALQRALEIKPNADVYNNLGFIRFYQGHYQEAVLAFEKTVALGANNFDNWANLADAYRQTPGNAEKAKQAYGNAIQLVRDELSKHPEQTDLHADLAMYLAKSGNKAGALLELKPVEQARSKDPSILYNSALVYELCGKRDEALSSLTAAVKAGQNLSDIKNEPDFVSLRADPRYHLKVLVAVPVKPSP